jgi:predicted nucleic acid-binding protein
MSASAAYIDSSAFVKLIVAEPESEALRTRLRRWPDRVSATLLRTETVRALRRSGNDHLIRDARRMFGAITLVRLDEPLLDRAGELAPSELRSLDAVHLAAALSIGPELGVVITYDTRLREAALTQGLDVESPGRP